MVHVLKYRHVAQLAHPIARAMADIPLPLRRYRVASIPLHPARLRQRGYNQAELIANAYAEIARYECVRPLERVRQTVSQVSLGRDERLSNVSGAFGVTDVRRVFGADILLIDDVFTTGSTMREAARTLKGAGAKSVTALAFAHG